MGSDQAITHSPRPPLQLSYQDPELLLPPEPCSEPQADAQTTVARTQN